MGELAMHPIFRIAVRHQDTEDVLCLAGELCFFTVPLLERETFRFRSPSSRSVVVDLHGLEFLDCAGLRALVNFSNEVAARGGHMTISRPSRPVARVIKLVGPAEWSHGRADDDGRVGRYPPAA